MSLLDPWRHAVIHKTCSKCNKSKPIEIRYCGEYPDNISYICRKCTNDKNKMIAYKLLRVRRDNSIGPLFINRKQRIPINTWLIAEDHPTKNYAHRMGWHCTIKPYAPHLSMKGRVWYEVVIEDFVKHVRPKNQGGLWFLAQRMMVIKRLDNKDVEII